MVPAHDQMGAAVVFPAKGVKDGLSGACVPHAGRKGRKEHSLDRVVFFDEPFVTGEAGGDVDVVLLGCAGKGVEKEAVSEF